MGSPAVLAEWSEKMRIKEDDDDRTIISKKLSFVLRHGAKTMELPIDEGGYVRISDLLAIESLFEGVQPEALIEVAEQSNRDKQRYEVMQDGDEWLMRATGKHTIQGLQGERPVKEKKARRGDRKESASGDRPQRQQRQLSEDEFCSRWRLDKLARVRLGELPAASRQLAMQRFSPGPQVPASDFPKVFVAFCKRFRGKGKDEAYGVEFDDKLDYEALGGGSSPSGGRSSTAPRSRGKKKAGKSKDLDEANFGKESCDYQDEPDFQEGDKNPFYPSPGSTPRSLDGSQPSPSAMAALSSSSGLAMTQLSSQPMHGPPSSPSRSAAPPRPPLATPPPPAYPPHGMPMLPANVGQMPHGLPPPPSHVPQVMGLAPDRSSGRVGGYKEMSFPGQPPGPPGQQAGPPGQQLGAPRGHHHAGPPGQQFGGPPGQQLGAPPGQQLGSHQQQLAQQQGWGRGAPGGYQEMGGYSPAPVQGYSPPRADGCVQYSEMSQYGNVHDTGQPQSYAYSPTQAYYGHMGTSSHPGSPQGTRPEMFYGHVDPSSQSGSPQAARATVPEGYQNGMMMGGWMSAGAR